MSANNKKQIISTQITWEEKERLLIYCDENEETISRVLRKALRDFLEKEGY